VDEAIDRILDLPRSDPCAAMPPIVAMAVTASHASSSEVNDRIAVAHDRRNIEDPLK
jgi:hypothetical protein